MDGDRLVRAETFQAVRIDPANAGHVLAVGKIGDSQPRDVTEFIRVNGGKRLVGRHLCSIGAGPWNGGYRRIQGQAFDQSGNA